MLDINDLDWNQIWMDRMARAKECYPPSSCQDYWEDEESARQYWNTRYADKGQGIAQTIEALPVTGQSRVLDIGAGPGVLSIPLAEQVAQVTAVEPSAGMLGVLRAIREERGIHNLICVPKRWDEVEVEADLDPPYDLVMASMSLGMFDIRAAIQKMEQVAKSRIYLVWFAGQTGWDLQAKALWPRLHQAEYHSWPGCDVLFNVLYQMGIHPQIRTTASDFGERFSSLDKTIEFFEQRYGASTENQRRVLAEYLKRVIVKENGAVIIPYSAVYMEFWWDKK